MLKEMRKKTVDFVKANYGKLLVCILAVVQLSSLFGFCVDVSQLINSITDIFAAVGAVVLVVGIAKFALALKDENGPGQSQAILFAVSGVILISLKAIVPAIAG